MLGKERYNQMKSQSLASEFVGGILNIFKACAFSSAEITPLNIRQHTF